MTTQTVQLRFLLAGLTAAQVHTAGAALAAELDALHVECVAAPAVEAHPEQRALVVRMQICPAGAADMGVLAVARCAVIAAAHRAQLPIKEVPGTHRLVDADEHADAA